MLIIQVSKCMCLGTSLLGGGANEVSEEVRMIIAVGNRPYCYF
jgi:hypothetical protein